GYYLSPEMAYDAEYGLCQRERTGYDRGYGLAHFGRAGWGRGYGGDYWAGRGGYDRDELNRRPATGGYPRGPGMRGGMGYAAGQRPRGYGADYASRGFAMGYDRGFGRHGSRYDGGYGR
ncbi:MAG TPA: hypothetical protein VF006_32835, partial [Longimicrobium sp.]